MEIGWHRVHICSMSHWLKTALIIFGMCAGWMAFGYLTTDDDEIVRIITAQKLTP